MTKLEHNYSDSPYGKEVPRAEEVEEELAQSPPVGESPVRYPTIPPQIQKNRPEAPPEKPSPLQIALAGQDIHQILPHLSEEERSIIVLRFDLSSGRRQIKASQMAEHLGLSLKQYAAKEHEILDQVNYLAEHLPFEEDQG